MFIKKQEYELLFKKAMAYDNIRESIQYSEDYEYTDPAEDANGVVLVRGIKSMTSKIGFDPFYILEQCGIVCANRDQFKIEFAQ